MKLGVSVNSVSDWQTGSTGPRAKSVEKLLVIGKWTLRGRQWKAPAS